MSAAVGNLPDPKFRKEVGLTLIEVETAQHDLTAAAVTIDKLRDEAPTDPEILYAAYRIHSDLAGEALLSLPRAVGTDALVGNAHELNASATSPARSQPSEGDRSRSPSRSTSSLQKHSMDPLVRPIAHG